jgi:hypothetical protein
VAGLRIARFLLVVLGSLAIASSHPLYAQDPFWQCYGYQGHSCGIIVVQISCNAAHTEYYYQWDGSRYRLVGCAPQPVCSQCTRPPCACLGNGHLLFNFDCHPCGDGHGDGDGSGGGGSGGDGSGGDGSGGGGCDLCSTLSQSNNYLNQILEAIQNLNLKIDLSPIISRLDRIISNQGIMITTMGRMSDDLTAIRDRLSVIDNRLMMLTNTIESRLGNIEVKLGNINSVLQDMRQLIELQGEKLDVIKDILSQVWDYLRDDQALYVMQYLTLAQLAYLEARSQYFYNTLFLTVSSYGQLADLLYSTFASQYQWLGGTNDLIRVVGGGFVPSYAVFSGPNEVVLYESGLLAGAVSGWLTAVNTHYLPIASFANFTIYLNLDHPEVFWVRQMLRLMLGVSFIFFFVKRRYEEFTAFFEVSDNA